MKFDLKHFCDKRKVEKNDVHLYDWFILFLSEIQFKQLTRNLSYVCGQECDLVVR